MASHIKGNTLIYALSDPANGNIRYVGKTCYSLKKRLTEHLRDKTVSYKTNWIKSLVRKGVKPHIEILEDLGNPSDEEWAIAEKFWIKYLRFLGCDLTNIAEGGEGGSSPSAETIAKRVQKLRGQKRTPEALANMSAAQKKRHEANRESGFVRIPSAASRAKLSESLKRAYASGVRKQEWSAESRAKMSKSKTGTKLSEASRAKVSAALVKRWAALKADDPTIGSKTRAKLAAIPKWGSEEHRAKIRAANLGRKWSVESKAKKSAYMKTQPPNPKAIAAMAEANRGKKRPAELVARISMQKIGRKASPETLIKQSLAQKGVKKDPAVVARMVATNTGKKRSPEVCARMKARSAATKQSNREAKALFNHLFPDDSPYLTH